MKHRWKKENKTHDPMVVSSNPGIVYWMDIVSHLCVVKIVMCV